MSTLPPTPSYDPNVPIVSSAGGTSSAYKDPNSPESIMRKTAQLNVQSIVDSKYDVKENFYGCTASRISSFGMIILFLISIFLFTVIRRTAKGFLLSLAFILLVMLLVLQKKNV